MLEFLEAYYPFITLAAALIALLAAVGNIIMEFIRR